MSRRPVLKVPSPQVNIPEVVLQKSDENFMKMAAKWIPLICAGAAVGVSVIALKEIHNTRKELVNIKKEHLSSASGGGNEVLSKKMELMESQLSKITEYLRNSQRPMAPQPVVRREEIIKKAVTPEPEEVKIINETPDPDEYEEVEVTDDEAE
jgi:hypothetical protein